MSFIVLIADEDILVWNTACPGNNDKHDWAEYGNAWDRPGNLEKAASDARGACRHFLGHFLYVLVRMEEEKFVRFGNKD